MSRLTAGCFRSSLPAVAGAVLGLLLFAIPEPGRANDRSAAIVWDSAAGAVVHAEAADEPRYPASLTKMMTLYLLFQDMAQGKLTLATPLAVTINAQLQPPSKLGLEAGETIAVEDAIKALVTKSANDVAVVVAENLAGSEAAFAERMTATARDLGMSATRFRNASGLPDPDQMTTARDMMVLGASLQAHFPRQYGYFKTQSFSFRGRVHKSHNRLVGKVEGVDGIKTGYIRASGFNVVTSARRGGRRLIAVVMGGASARSRDQQMEALIAAYLPGGAAPPLVLAAAAMPAALSPGTGAERPSAASAAKIAYGIQIGTWPTRDTALQALQDAQSVHGEILADLSPVAEPYRKAVRAGFAGFADRRAAAALCARLKKKQVSCQVFQF